MDPREQRGLMIAGLCKITKKDGQWVVPSQTGTGATYRANPNPVNPTVPLCTCPDFETRNQKCKHVFAVEYVMQRERSSPDGTETITETVTVKAERVVAKKPTYKQNWPAYNAAQTNEKDKIQSLLADLRKGIEEPVQEKGRPRASLRDMVFASVFKVFSTVSARRFQCDLNDACERGYISKAPHYNTVFKYLEMPGLTPILKQLIKESALPLGSVEVDFAADSLGFSSSRFIRWFDHKYGCPRQKYDWVKVHIMTGVKTNIVTAVIIDDKYAHDSPQFPALVNETAKNFKFNEVSADGGYSSYANNELVAQHGGTPYIAFKVNAKPTEDSVYKRMFHYYNLKRDDFLSHYHKRSNMETTFSMVKAKFGDSLRSKTDTAMINEALCKILCHNLCCLVQSAYELSVTATFWGKEASPAPANREEVDSVDAWAWV
jgi:transposase